MNAKLKCKNKACGEYEYRDKGVFDMRSTKRFFCCTNCMVAQAASDGAKKADKAAKQAERNHKKDKVVKEKKDRIEHKAKKYSIKSHREKLADAGTVFNELRRMQEFKWFKDRGLEPVCTSCRKPLGGDQWAAGHLKTAGTHTNTRFDPLNVWLQHNVKCNKFDSGDIENYKLGLMDRFGEAEGQRIIDHCEAECNKVIRFADEEFKEMKAKWRKEIRVLKVELGLNYEKG